MNTRLLSLLFGFLLAATTIGVTFGQAPDRWPGAVERVVDGDTVDVAWDDGSDDRINGEGARV